MQKIIIMGAGAIGRGYLPWVFQPEDYDLIFIDTNPAIISQMRAAGHFVTYRVRNDRLEGRKVRVAAAYLPDEFRAQDHQNAAACFLSVGPRNVERAAETVKGLGAPLILCENEPNAVGEAKRVVGHERVYFAVPDVITSNSAPQRLLQEDPLTVITEDGVLFIEEGPAGLRGDFTLMSRERLLDEQWMAKLYLHNTPHCIAAYLGAIVGADYVHEAMAIPQVNVIIEGAMAEMLKALKMKWSISHAFLDWYAEKELARFRCRHLYDPVARVAREPLRKLEVHGRLIGAAQICLSQGVVPQNILTGITGALMFEDKRDPDHHLALLRRSLPSDLFNVYILGLRSGEPLDLLLREQIDGVIQRLSDLPKVAAA